MCGWGNSITGLVATYISKSSIQVWVNKPVINRENRGCGTSNPKILSDAHGLAFKEAEIDTINRVLIAFGSLFSLALCHKDKISVTEIKPKEQITLFI